MAARDLLDPRLLLFGLGCAGCEIDPFVPIEQISERRCELEPVSDADPRPAPPGRMLEPTTDSRVACGKHAGIVETNLAVSPSGVYLLAEEWNYGDYWFWRLDHTDGSEHATISQLWLAYELSWWARLAVDDGGVVSVFGNSIDDSLWRGTSNDEWEPKPLGLDAGSMERVEIAGSQPHLWYDWQVHATSSHDGAWFEEPMLGVEGMGTSAVGLDGSGEQLAYALDLDGDELWTFDGASTKLVADVPGGSITPIPTAHPTDPGHEHAAVMESSSGLWFIWPTRESDPMWIPASPSHVSDPDDRCLRVDDLVAARTADGRIWIAWIVSAYLPDCVGDGDLALEDGTLRLVEIDPKHELPREAMRLELDTANLAVEERSLGFSGDVYYMYDGALSIAAFGQQLVLAVADGPESARVRVMSFDTGR